MDTDNTSIPHTVSRTPLIIGAIVVGLIAALAAVWIWALQPALAVPEKADYSRFDIERQVIDVSVGTYGPLLKSYSTEYANAYREQRSDEEKERVYAEYSEKLAREQQVIEAYLARMEGSVALKEPAVAESFRIFNQKYTAVLDYYERYFQDVTGVTRSITGPCAQLSRLNVAKDSHSSEYTKAADICIKALDTAKQESDGATKTLLNDVTSIVKTRRDKFNDVIGKEGLEQSSARLQALASLLTFNADLNKVQTRYQEKVQKEYEPLVKEANAANDDLKKTLATYGVKSTQEGSEE